MHVWIQFFRKSLSLLCLTVLGLTQQLIRTQLHYHLFFHRLFPNQIPVHRTPLFTSYHSRIINLIQITLSLVYIAIPSPSKLCQEYLMIRAKSEAKIGNERLQKEGLLAFRIPISSRKFNRYGPRRLQHRRLPTTILTHRIVISLKNDLF